MDPCEGGFLCLLPCSLVLSGCKRLGHDSVVEVRSENRSRRRTPNRVRFQKGWKEALACSSTWEMSAALLWL